MRLDRETRSRDLADLVLGRLAGGGDPDLSEGARQGADPFTKGVRITASVLNFVKPSYGRASDRRPKPSVPDIPALQQSQMTLILPREPDREAQIQCVRGFAHTLVKQGMVVGWALHGPRATDGGCQPHPHLLCALGEIDPRNLHGFGLVRERDSRAVLVSWREGRCGHVKGSRHTELPPF